MIGKLFARTLKQNVELRHDFEAFLKEQRDHASRALESAEIDIVIFRCQGKILALDALLTTLEYLDTSAE